MSPVQFVLLSALLPTLAHSDSSGGEIINGKKAKKSQMLYMASVQKNGKHICGGFLISERFILSAAHCDEGGNLSVILGTHNVNPKQKNILKFDVVKKYKPKAYKDVRSGNDIMLLQLSKPVKKGKAIKYAKIPVKDKDIKSNSRCLVAGWGLTEPTVKSVDDLRVVDVTTIDAKICQNLWKTVNIILPANIICAGGYNTTKGACQGDSGGPLVCSGLAVGIVSFNLGGNCQYPNVPNVYTLISKYLPWIKSITKRIS